MSRISVLGPTHERSLDAVVQAICMRENLNPKVPEDLVRATLLAAGEAPDLLPTYGTGRNLRAEADALARTQQNLSRTERDERINAAIAAECAKRSIPVPKPTRTYALKFSEALGDALAAVHEAHPELTDDFYRFHGARVRE